MKFRNLAVAAAGMAFLAASAFAQITTIEGVAKGPDGKPLDKAEVLITRTDIKGNYKCDTNKKGHYFYNGLPLGTYNITVEIGGKEMDGIKGVRTILTTAFTAGAPSSPFTSPSIAVIWAKEVRANRQAPAAATTRLRNFIINLQLDTIQY